MLGVKGTDVGGVTLKQKNAYMASLLPTLPLARSLSAFARLGYSWVTPSIAAFGTAL